MNGLDLFMAIGNVNEEYLLESEIRPVHRPKWKAAIAAAAAVLVLTACTAPVIYGAIRDAQLQRRSATGETEKAEENDGNPLRLVSELDSYSVVIDFELAANIPETVETAYLPTYAPESWLGGRYCVQGDYAVYGNWFTAVYTEAGELNGIEQVMYTQIPACDYDPENKEIHRISVKPDGAISSQVRRVGDYDVLEIAVREGDRELLDTETGRTIWIAGWSKRYLYWSDGVYLFHLMIPYESDMTEVDALILSIEPAVMPALTLEEYGQIQHSIMDQVSEEVEKQENGE